MLNQKLTQLKNHFGIFKLADWQSVEPSWILGQDGCGPKTLAYLRVLLATHGLTLKGDRTPEYWKAHYPDVQIVDSLTDDDDGQDRGVLCPFTVLVDSGEQQPFTFTGFKADADQDYRPLIVPTERRSLGRFPDSLGDYSLDCGVNRCHVERKSMKDAQGTILGWHVGSTDPDGVSRRDRFERELHNLSEMLAGLVVVECSFIDLVRHAPETRHKSAQENAKILYRSVIAWQMRFSVKWFFCESRELAEKVTFDWLRRFYEDQQEIQKEQSRERKRIAASVNGRVATPVAAPVAASVEVESALQELF